MTHSLGDFQYVFLKVRDVGERCRVVKNIQIEGVYLYHRLDPCGVRSSNISRCKTLKYTGWRRQDNFIEANIITSF